MVSDKFKILLGTVITTATIWAPMITHAESIVEAGENYCRLTGHRGEQASACSLLVAMFSSIPTLWPGLTTIVIGDVSVTMSKMLSNSEKLQLAMAEVEASEVLANYYGETDTVKDQNLSPNFLAVKANIEARLHEMNLKQLGLSHDKITSLNHAQTAFLILALNTTP